jgi:hypothetical protein
MILYFRFAKFKVIKKEYICDIFSVSGFLPWYSVWIQLFKKSILVFSVVIFSQSTFADWDNNLPICWRVGWGGGPPHTPCSAAPGKMFLALHLVELECWVWIIQVSRNGCEKFNTRSYGRNRTCSSCDSGAVYMLTCAHTIPGNRDLAELKRDRSKPGWPGSRVNACREHIETIYETTSCPLRISRD